MLKSTGKLIKGLFVLLALGMVNHAMAEVIHSERSLYRNILAVSYTHLTLPTTPYV